MMCPPLVIRWVPSSALGWASLLLLEQVRILSSPGMHLDFCMEVVLDVFTRPLSPHVLANFRHCDKMS